MGLQVVDFTRHSGVAFILTNEEKIRAVKEGRYDINQLMLDNEGLVKDRVYKYARRCCLSTFETEDMLQIARAALFKAIQDFDETIGVKLSTLATRYIDCDIRKFFHRNILEDRGLLGSDEAEYDSVDEQTSAITVTKEDKAFGRNYSTQGLNLSERQEFIFFNYAKGYTMEEIAEMIGATKQTVNVHLKIAQQRMRAKYNYTY